MKTTMKTMMTALALTTLTACDRNQQASFDRERSEEKYQSALADATSGQIDAAVKGFEEAVASNPGNASARFQLAVLLQDEKSDYLGALCHYREYLLLAPESDKSAVARERAENCENLLARTLAKRNNLTDNTELEAELARVKDEKASAEALGVRLQARVEELEKAMKTAEKERDSLRKFVERFRTEDDDDRPAPSRPAVAARPAAVREDPGLTDAEAAARVARAAALIAEEDAPSNRPAVAAAESEEPTRPRPVKTAPVEDEAKPLTLNPEAVALNEEAEREERSSLLTALSPEQVRSAKDARARAKEARAAEKQNVPARPAQYVVKEGETLSQIALRFYGRKSEWVRIQKANRATVPLNGDVRAGTVLTLP